MHIDYLIQMTNDIAAFFVGDNDEAAAAANIHQHIAKFWDQRMKSQIVAHYQETGGRDLQDAVRMAVRLLAEETGKKTG
jgi:formate dehydrogenase subunit delta